VYKTQEVVTSEYRKCTCYWWSRIVWIM